VNLFDPEKQREFIRNFPEREFVFVPVLDSTHLECSRLWEKRHQSWIVVANQQTKGRGRYGRVWESPADANLYVSWVQPNPWGRSLGLLNLACGVILYKAIAEAYGTCDQNLTLKWPNDLYCGDQKLAGILLQSLDPDFSQVIIGMGINVYAKPEDLPSTATSMAIAYPNFQEHEARSKILHQLLLGFQQSALLEYLQKDDVQKKFWEYSVRAQQHFYTYTAFTYTYQGKLNKLYPNGTAQIQTDQGQIVDLTV